MIFQSAAICGFRHQQHLRTSKAQVSGVQVGPRLPPPSPAAWRAPRPEAGCTLPGVFVSAHARGAWVNDKSSGQRNPRKGEEKKGTA